MDDIIWSSGDNEFLFQCWKYFKNEHSKWVKHCLMQGEKLIISRQPFNVLLLSWVWNTKPFHCNIFCERWNLWWSHIYTCSSGDLFTKCYQKCFHMKAHLTFHCCLYDKVKKLNVLAAKSWKRCSNFCSWGFQTYP